MKEKNKGGLLGSINPLRNYLVLIFVFAALVCISVVFLLAMGTSGFGATERWVLIGFLAAFSFFSLGSITWLVLRHANKLAVAGNDRDIEWENVSPEKQKFELNKEVKELAESMNIPDEHLNDLRSAYIVAEDLALRKIQQETKSPLLRHVSIGNIGFSALDVEDDLVTCIHVSFVVAPDIGQKKIGDLLKKLSMAKTTLARLREGSRIRLLLVLVTQLDRENEAKLRSSLVTKFSATPVDVDIRMLDFQRLQRTFSE